MKRLQELLKKLADGTLTDDERTELAGINAQEVADQAAAAARRQAEQARQQIEQQHEALKAELQQLKDKAEADKLKGKPEAERMQHELERLKVQIAEKDAMIAGMKADAAKAARTRKIDEAIRKHQIAFIPEVDAEAMTGLLRSRLEGLADADLDDEAKAGSVVKAFVQSNPAIIVDTTGEGSKGGPRKPGGGSGSADNPWKKETWNLTRQGEIVKKDPAQAARLKAEAGAK